MASETGHEARSFTYETNLTDGVGQNAWDTSDWPAKETTAFVLPIHEPTLPIHEPLMNHPVPFLTQTCKEPSPFGNRFCALFGPVTKR